MVHWSNIEAAKQDAISRIFDRTSCSLQPMAKLSGPNGPASKDAARASFDFMATVDLEPQGNVIAGQNGVDPSVTFQSAAYDALFTAYVSAWAYIPKHGDIITIDGGKSYFVMTSRQDGSSRRGFFANEVKS